MSSASSAGGCKMRNRILHLTRNTIPYVKDLRPLVGSVAGCILMQQLDYWFERIPDGFWKFLSPAVGHRYYRPGDSWIEELGMSEDEFRTAFDKIGTRYKSKKEFDEALEKFQGKFYCSYLDRRENLTWYFRNHILVDNALDGLVFNTAISANEEGRFTVNRESPFTGNQGSQFTQMGVSHSQEIGNPHFNNTETTSSQNTQTPLQQTSGQDDLRSGIEIDLVFPKILSTEEKVAIEEWMQQVRNRPKTRQQELLDELANAISKKTIRTSVVQFLRTLVQRELQGEFTPSGGVAILAARNAEKKNCAMVKAEFEIDPVAYARGKELYPQLYRRGQKI